MAHRLYLHHLSLEKVKISRAYVYKAIRLYDSSLAHRISSGQAKIICVSTKSEPHGQKWRMYNKKRKSKNSFNITCSKNRLCFPYLLVQRVHQMSYGVNQGGEYQKRFWQSVSAQVVACLAVITLIKACQQNLEITQKANHFFTFLGPTGLLNTKVL